MSIISDTKKAFDYVRHPNATGDSYTVKSALKFYYRAMILPMIAALVITLVISSVVGAAFSILGRLLGFLGLGALGMALGIGIGIAVSIMLTIMVLLSFIVLIPISIIINAAILQFFSKFVFRIWKGDFSKTLAAMMFGTLPIILFLWLAFIPIVGFIMVIFSIWSIVVLIMALSRQHNIGIGRAFIGWLIPYVIVGSIEIGVLVLLHVPI